MPFEKGDPRINRAGRAEGSKNKNCMRPVFWWNWFEELVKEQTEVEQAKSIKWALELLMPKVPALPISPEESVANVNALLGRVETPEPPAITPPQAETLVPRGVNGA